MGKFKTLKCEVVSDIKFTGKLMKDLKILLPFRVLFYPFIIITSFVTNLYEEVYKK